MTYSIILPLYNKQDYISATISSVLAQKHEDFELIVVNDSSTDDSLNEVHKFVDPRIKVFTKPNGGVSAARNFGIMKSSGEIICFLDADDIWHVDYLKELDKLVNTFVDIGFFCTSYRIFRGFPEKDDKIVDMRSYNKDDVFVADFFRSSVFRFGSIALTSSVAIRRTILKNMDHWFEEGVNMGEDVDMWVRAALQTKVVYNNNPLMYYRAATVDGLSCSFYSYKHSIDYSRWYNLSSDKYVHRFTSQMLYDLAKVCYLNKQYIDSRNSLLKIKGNFLFCRRLVLLTKDLFLICRKRKNMSLLSKS